MLRCHPCTHKEEFVPKNLRSSYYNLSKQHKLWPKQEADLSWNASVWNFFSWSECDRNNQGSLGVKRQCLQPVSQCLVVTKSRKLLLVCKRWRLFDQFDQNWKTFPRLKKSKERHCEGFSLLPTVFGHSFHKLRPASQLSTGRWRTRSVAVNKRTNDWSNDHLPWGLFQQPQSLPAAGWSKVRRVCVKVKLDSFFFF